MDSGRRERNSSNTGGTSRDRMQAGEKLSRRGKHVVSLAAPSFQVAEKARERSSTGGLEGYTALANGGGSAPRWIMNA